MRMVIFLSGYMLYVSSNTLCFGENVEIDTTVTDGDKILHIICTVPDILNWLSTDAILINSDNVPVFLRV